VEICGTEGRLWIDRSRFEYYPLGRNVQPTVVPGPDPLTQAHVNHFLECVKTRKRPNGDVLTGARSGTGVAFWRFSGVVPAVDILQLPTHVICDPDSSRDDYQVQQ
jgi:hypothetical protein